MKFTLTALIVLVTANFAQACPPYLIDRKTGRYLGNLSTNQYDPNSVNNPNGRYGSKYSVDSINNPNGQYGSRYSSDSATNPFAGNPPAIYSSDRSVIRAR